MAGKKQFTFIWKIENFSFTKTTGTRNIYSPYFMVEDFESTQWRLLLQSNDDNYEFLGLYLCRSEFDGGPEQIHLNYEFSLLTSTAENQEFIGSNAHQFPSANDDGKLFYCWGRSKLINRNELFGRMKSEFLPGDVITIHCRLWQGEGKVLNHGNATGRSIVGYDKISFPWKINSFSSLKPRVKKTTDVSSLFFSNKSVIFHLFLETHLNNLKIIIDIVLPAREKCPCVSCCTIYIITASGYRVECAKAHMENAFQRRQNGEHFWSLTFSITKQDILDKKQSYLPNDALFLLCELTLSNGDIILSEITDTIFTSGAPKKRKRNELRSGHDVSKKTECLKKNLWTMYEDGVLTDINLKTKTKTFSAHSVILCARSSVFQAMLTTEMREKQERCITVDEMEDDTVSRLLQFMYCDTVEGLEWENAVNLYSAADKYDILPLREICSTFLKGQLTKNNVCQALELSDSHNDDVFKCAVQDFIAENQNVVFKLNTWKTLEKKCSSLAIEVLHKIIEK